MPRRDDWGVRCRHCGKPLALRLRGELEIMCRWCKRLQVIRHQDDATITYHIAAQPPGKDHDDGRE